VNALRRALSWLDDRTGLSGLLGPLARHVVPRRTGWMYVFGSATLVVFIVQVVTGMALATTYIPSTGDAYQSLQFITQRAFLGSVIRGIHYFGASAMVVLIGMHAIRVFLTGSYKFPREVNWLSGVLLLALTLAMAFTGQLLRWDQNAVWSVVVGAEQAGRTPMVGKSAARFLLAGDVVGGATLSRFFAFHVLFLPALIFGLLGLHLYLVLRNGISEPVAGAERVDPKTYRDDYERLLRKDGVAFWPHAAWRDVVVAVGVVVLLVALAVWIGPPLLGKPPDPTIVQADPRPDWYFLWYFALLALIPHGTEPYVIILGPLAAGLLLVAVPFLSARGDRAPRRRPWAVGSVAALLAMIASLTVAGMRADWSPDFTAQPLPAAVVGHVDAKAVRGAELFHAKGCEYCHAIEGHGGRRGPDLTEVADRMTAHQMTLRILNGRGNMPSFASILAPSEVDELIAFLRTRTASELATGAASAR
jgi:ubiquinol-cytochrome c reductase cytochrome b subunit